MPLETGEGYKPAGLSEIGFIRYFYKPEPIRMLKEIRADVLAVERET